MTFEELIKEIEAESPSINVKKLIQIAIMSQEFIKVVSAKNDRKLSE